MLVATGRGPIVENLGLEEIGVELDKRKGIAADEHRRTTVPHIYAVGDCAGYWQLAHTAFREGEVAAENAMGHEAVVDNRGVPRPIYTDPEIAGVGLTEAEAREQHGDDVAVGVFPWVANARAVMQNETVGWVKSIHETRYGELLGLVMVGPHVTDLIEAGTVALDAEATVETVADGMAAHPTLSEGIKEAGLVGARPRNSHAESQARRRRRVAVSENGRSPFKQHGGLPRRRAAIQSASATSDLQAAGRSRLRAALQAPRARGLPVRARAAGQPGRRRGRHPDDVPQRLPRIPEGRAAAQAAQLADRDHPQRLPDALAPGRLASARGRARRGARAGRARRGAAELDEVLTALAVLSFNQRAAIVMRELEGRSYQEISGVLGVSVSAVEALLFRARRNLQVRRKALGVLTTVPLPGSLASFIGGGGGAVAAGGAAFGADLVFKAAAVVAVGTATVGAGYAGVRSVQASHAQTPAAFVAPKSAPQTARQRRPGSRIGAPRSSQHGAARSGT